MKHLTLADEIVVLMLDDETGTIKSSCAGFANLAIAGGMLMELALLGRIDTDLKSLFVVDQAPVGDALLDRVLRDIAAESEKRPSLWWIERLGLQKQDLSAIVLERLVAAGILRVEERRVLWMFARRAYPQNSGREEREAKARLMAVVFDDAVPDARDALLLALADSSGVLNAILSADEKHKAAARIAQVVALEEISRSVRVAELNLRAALAAAATARSW